MRDFSVTEQDIAISIGEIKGVDENGQLTIELPSVPRMPNNNRSTGAAAARFLKQRPSTAARLSWPLSGSITRMVKHFANAKLSTLFSGHQRFSRSDDGVV